MKIDFIIEDNSNNFDFEFITSNELEFDFECIFKLVEGETYTGEYIVTPNVFVQTLDTNNKLMTDDVTVLEIPYSEVSNLYGTTISIAS